MTERTKRERGSAENREREDVHTDRERPQAVQGVILSWCSYIHYMTQNTEPLIVCMHCVGAWLLQLLQYIRTNTCLQMG